MHAHSTRSLTSSSTTLPPTTRRRATKPFRQSRGCCAVQTNIINQNDDAPRARTTVDRRALVASALTFALTASVTGAGEAARADDGFTSTKDGVTFRDVRAGNGQEVYAGDAVVILFSARVLPSDGSDIEKRKLQDTFDPFIVGGAGTSMSKGFKLEIASPTNDIPEGWERAFEGDGAAMPRARIGTHRIVRIPPALAYGERGHHCRDGVRGACEVNPGESVEIDFEILRFT